MSIDEIRKLQQRKDECDHWGSGAGGCSDCHNYMARLAKEVPTLLKEIDRLQEFEAMYEGLCK